MKMFREFVSLFLVYTGSALVAFHVFDASVPEKTAVVGLSLLVFGVFVQGCGRH